MKNIILGLIVFTGLNANATTFECTNRSNFEGKIEFKLKQNKKGYSATASQGDASCKLSQMDYNPTSDKYEGWIRVGTDKTNCKALSKSLFGISTHYKNGIGIYWISVSTEMQDGKEGFAQLGYENVSDPGAGAVMKMFLSCKVK